MLTSKQTLTSIFRNIRAVVLCISILAIMGFEFAQSSFAGETASEKNWPQFRYDSFRSATTPHELPAKLTLAWERELPAPRSAWRNPIYNFDNGYEPIVWGDTLLLASNRNDNVTAYDIATGKEKWRFMTDGPVRIAPAVYKGNVFIQSDDGYLYCLAIANGALRWKKAGHPYDYGTGAADRKYFGNNRMISCWPLRGGALLKDDKIFYTAGLFQPEGVFMYGLNADTGKEIWLNDAVGSIIGITGGSHDIKGIVAGHIPQGYLVQLEADKSLFVLPANRSGTRNFDFATGQYRTYRQDTHRAWKKKRYGWAVQKDGFGHRSYPREITAGSKKFDAAALKALGHVGKPWSFAAAQDRLFVISKAKQWKISCYGASAPAKPTSWKSETTPLKKATDAWTSTIKDALSTCSLTDRGLALVWGVGNGRIIEELIQQSELQIIAFDTDKEKVNALRKIFIAAGLYGARVSVHAAQPFDWNMPPYTFRLIVSADTKNLGLAVNKNFLPQLYRLLRPFGGTALLPTTAAEHSTLDASPERSNLISSDLQKKGRFTVLTRKGRLPGTMDYTKKKPPETFDKLARPPFAISWFGELPLPFASTYKHIRRPPGSPDILDGIMISKAKTTADVYTGIMLKGKQEYSGAKGHWLARLRSWKRPTFTQDPVYDIFRPMKIWRGGGCGSDFMGNLEVFRSGCAGYVDIRKNSGTIHFAPARPGCGGDVNMMAANGMLLFPMQFGCPCNVAMQAAFGFYPKPDTEYWVYYTGERLARPVETDPIKRIGVNFGAIGDRNEDSSVWFHQPRISGNLFTGWLTYFDQPEKIKRYAYHSTRINNSEGHNWVASSGVKGATKIRAPLSFGVYAHRINTAPTIDASLNDACWDGQDPYMLWYEHKGAQQLNTPIAKREFGPTYFRYDTKTLYIGARSFQKGEGKKSITWRFFLSDQKHAESGRILRYLEFIIDDKGVLTTNNVSTSTKFGNPEKEPLPGKCSAAATNNKEGFFVELAIPWSVLAEQNIDLTKMIFGSRGPNRLQTRYYSYKQMCVRAQPVFLDGVPRGIIGKHRPYTVRLTFAEPDDSVRPGDRVFNVKLQGKTVLSNFDITKEAGGTRRAVVREFKTVQAREELVLELVPVKGETLISGMEILGKYTINHKPKFIPSPSPSTLQTLKKGRLDFRFRSTNLDPDNEPVTLIWLLDGKPVHTQKNRFKTSTNRSHDRWYYIPKETTNQRHSMVLKADDGKGGVTTKTWLINLPGAKTKLPTADIAMNTQVGVAPLTVAFDGSNSKDEDGTIKSYAWTIKGEAAGTDKQFSHTFSKPGIYHITLTVEDNLNALGIKEVLIYVFPSTPVRTNASKPKAPQKGRS